MANEGTAASRTQSRETSTHNDNHSRAQSRDPSDTLLSRIQYCLSSFQAVFTPVSITMILSALAVVNINTSETRAEGEAAYSQTYEVFDLNDGDRSQNIMASLANVLIIISVICVMTFVIVLLYKYGCTKLFLGYMVVVTAMLLGYFTSNVALVAIEKYELRVDKLSFAYLIWNYAAVGVLAIFYNRGIPKFVTQGYLVTTSVVLAWQLSYFNTWTAWTLLVMLGLYDLFAVLTPCGPLKALANLMSRPGAQPLPGLLYEASLPGGVSRPSRPNRVSQEQHHEEEQEQEHQQVRSEQQSGGRSRSSEVQTSRHRQLPEDSAPDPMMQNSSAFISERLPQDELESSTSMPVRMRELAGSSQQNMPIHFDSYRSEARSMSPPQMTISDETPRRAEQRTGQTALAIAQLYKLQVIDEEGVLVQRNNRRDGAYHQREYTPEEVRATNWTPRQLRTEVTVVFPSRGGRIVKAADQNSAHGPKYLVYNRRGDLLRTFVVDRNGKILQVMQRDSGEQAERGNDSIKLGLGDFIFYSLLVSKAAMYSFTAFATCMVTILFGLGATLVLLSVHGKALPALPISIFLAVVMFLLTQYLVEPYIQEILRLPYYA